MSEHEDPAGPMIEMTILDDAGRNRRRSEDGRGQGSTVTLCSEEGCSNMVSWGRWCRDHRPPPAPPPDGWPVVADLTSERLAEVRREVEADAAPLFIAAMNWIARRQVARMGLELGPGES